MAETMNQEYNTTPEETQRQVSAKLKAKGKKKIEKTLRTLERLTITYVPIDSVMPNAYNPNRLNEHQFSLLVKSIEEDGFTQPIIVLQESKVIVDGEHRWRACQVLGFDEIPVVFVDMDPKQTMISTLRHNEGRGSHDIELEAQVRRDLQALGALEWAKDSMMMSDIELQRLLTDIKAPESLAGSEYGPGWMPDQIGETDRAIAQTDSTEAYTLREEANGTVHVGAMSQKAAGDIREREKIFDQAKSTEELNMKRKDSKLFRLALIFSGEEAELVKSVLGKSPAEAILSLCREHETREQKKARPGSSERQAKARGGEGA